LPSQPTTLSIPELRAALTGRVIAPDDAGYDEARTVFLGGIDRRPTVIVRVADATDVSYVVSLARETGLELAVRSGGHSSAGHSVSEGGIVLDLSDMRALDIGCRTTLRVGRDGVNEWRVHDPGGGPRPRDRVRRYGLGRDRRDHPRWRRRLPRA
jgi:FAD/FMN-containing dehydrogenase